jgi:hypothetical protein
MASSILEWDQEPQVQSVHDFRLEPAVLFQPNQARHRLEWWYRYVNWHVNWHISRIVTSRAEFCGQNFWTHLWLDTFLGGVLANDLLENLPQERFQGQTNPPPQTGILNERSPSRTGFFDGGPCRARTYDLWFWRPPLYQLS